MAGSDIGTNTVIEAQSTIGATGVAWVWDQNSRERVVQPQTGSVKIGPDCFLGTGITVVRGSVNEATEIGEGSVIAHGSRIGHGCRIGARAHFANNVTLAGNVTLGPECFIAAGATIQPQVRLAERTVVGIGSVVVRNFEEPNCLLAGMPARKIGSAEKVLPGVPLHLRGERS
jgi:UDP-3-O-[3-hydroxymyristoyl] glucosamine N-acyltransferase